MWPSSSELFEDEEAMDLEEISDDDLEDERQAKFSEYHRRVLCYCCRLLYLMSWPFLSRRGS